jgi:hypothetical protein
VLRQATGNIDSLDSPWPRLGGSHHLPPYSILCVTSSHLHPNGFFSRDSQSGVPKLSRFGLPGLWAFITSCSDLRLGWGLKQICSSPWEFSNGVSHSTCTHKGQVDSRLLVVRSQIACLTPGLSFDPYNRLWVFGSPRGLSSPIFGNVNGDLTLPSKWGCDIIDGCSPLNQPTTTYHKRNPGALEVPIDMIFALIMSHINNIPMNRHIKYVMYKSDKLIHTNIKTSVDYGRLVLRQKLNYITYIELYFQHMLHIFAI